MSAFLESMVQYYGQLSLLVVTRANAARVKIDAGTYGPTDVISDTLSIAIGGVEGWWDAALRPVTTALPAAFLKLRVGDAAAGPGTVPVGAAHTGTPTGTDLTSVSGPTTISAATHLTVAFAQKGGVDDRTQLQVGLRNLTVPSSPPAGVYQGFVFVDQTALAHIVAVIS